MMKVKTKYPCGVEIELKVVNIISFLFGGFIRANNGDYRFITKWDCPLHGKDCKSQKIYYA